MRSASDFMARLRWRIARLRRPPFPGMRWISHRRQPLDEVEWVGAPEAIQLTPDDAVLGLVMDGNAYSPLGTWLAVAYAAMVDGRRLQFDPDGFRMVDRQTGSCWDLTGRAVSGSLAGAQLRFLASRLEQWQTLAARHPGIVLASNAPAAGDARQHGEGTHAGGR